MRMTLGVVLLLSAYAAFGQSVPPSTSITVDCNKGQSLNQTLAKLNRQTPYSVSVNGTCTEFVQVIGFHNLVVKALPGATLVQPSTGGGNLINSTLFIESSQSVQVEGFSVQGNSGALANIGIGHGSTDIRLRSLNVQGGNAGGIIIFENSQVSIAYVHVQDVGFQSVGIYDSSDVHVEHCLFENTTSDGWHQAISVGASHVTMYATTIRNMQQAIGGGPIPSSIWLSTTRTTPPVATPTSSSTVRLV